MKFFPSFCNFNLSSYCVEIFQKTYTSTFICCLCPVKEARPKTKHKRRYREEKSGRFVLKKKTSFPGLFCSRSGIYYALFLCCFDLIILPKILYCVYWVVVEIWVSNSFHKICNKFFIRWCQGWKECLFLCEVVWFFYNLIPICLSWNLSHFVPNYVGIVT